MSAKSICEDVRLSWYRQCIARLEKERDLWKRYALAMEESYNTGDITDEALELAAQIKELEDDDVL